MQRERPDAPDGIEPVGVVIEPFTGDGVIIADAQTGAVEPVLYQKIGKTLLERGGLCGRFCESWGSEQAQAQKQTDQFAHLRLLPRGYPRLIISIISHFPKPSTGKIA